MFSKITMKASVLQVVISWLVSFMVVSTAQLALAGFIGVPSSMQSQGPCLYSLQLQKSVAERQRYLAKLSEVTGGAVASSNAVEDMYSNIQPASYGSDNALEGIDLWGVSPKSVPDTRLGVDVFSTDCISCHDGASAVAIEANWRNSPLGGALHGKLSGSDHPIGMDYESYVAANSRKYKSVFGLNSKMVFVDGKVGCLTCHDPLNPERGHLVMSDRKSALCLTCHDK